MTGTSWGTVGSVVTGGKNAYGVPLGILLLESRFPRIPGDVGNASTWPFPVTFQVVKGATPDGVVRKMDRDRLLAPFVDSARALERSGVPLITTGCGFLVLFQEELRQALNVPILTSSLLQVPWVLASLPKDQGVGIITVEQKSLTSDHLVAAGIRPDDRVVVAGLDHGDAYFTTEILGDGPSLDVERARVEHVETARRLVESHPEIGAIVLECTNMPPYAADIARVTGRPVFDLTTMVRWGVSSLRQIGYSGFM